ncbi:MAG: CDP-diacylglycerol--glycerol-3-phosphate 3-phosphatidyltransferase [Elusimicrobia bacterium]|nr:CDP-diacylglycerol--glycerol-3-phosphate 3-phosphatidyltransferase [Elusimicrobiota bacterium]
MNLANRMTMLRIVLAVAMVLALARTAPASHLLALALYVAAVATDWIDGWLARRTNTTSAFGKIADPIADKILVLGALIALLKTRELGVPPIGVFLILARELLLGGLRTLAAAHGKVLAAERWGKWKMGVQSVSVLAMLLILVGGERWSLPLWIEPLPRLLTWLCVVVTWLSAYLYYRQTRTVIENSWR